MYHTILSKALLIAFLVLPLAAAEPDTLPGAQPLSVEGDIAAQMVAGVDKFLLRKIDESVAKRASRWESIEGAPSRLTIQRQRLHEILGVTDSRIAFENLEHTAAPQDSGPMARGDGYEVFAVRWPVLGSPDAAQKNSVSVEGVGLLLVPTNKEPISDVIAIPDADQTPEQIVGLAEGVPPKSQYARRLAENGCRVLVPMLINREMHKRNERANLTSREYLYRSSFELGRHLIGYEIQKMLAGIDWLQRSAKADGKPRRTAMVGYGEGGMLALYAGALDQRCDIVVVSGYFDDRRKIWRQGVDRNVFGLLRDFGDAELVAMAAPSLLVVENTAYPVASFPSEGGAPGRLVRPPVERVLAEHERFDELVLSDTFGDTAGGLTYSAHASDDMPLMHDDVLAEVLDLEREQRPAAPGAAPRMLREGVDAALRQSRQIEQLDRHNQALLAESPYVRKQRFWDKLDDSSVEAFEKAVAPFREEFRHDVIGHFDDKPLPFNPRTRKAYDEEKWVGYEVMLDLWPDVFCYGILCLPKDMNRDGSEKRPVVVCQHGLEGRPQDIVTGDHGAYHNFASQLCERGFITFSPQNLYIGRDNFRTLQRKANPLGKTLFSIITPQHQQIVDWLKTQPYVDGERIGFYGLSYGGKTAMRVPPLVEDYKCVICSADFNDWVWKNTSTRSPYSYVWTGEYEIFEWNLGHTFNYAEMAALIAPRPFMVERGHFDGVAPDERVAYEFAKVRHLYNARLKLPADHCQIEWFDGPHTINGKGTFAFLHRHLDWPAPKGRTEK